MKNLLIIFFLTCFSAAFGQDPVKWIEPNDEELAIQFYQEGEYEKAVSLFRKLAEKDNSPRLYDYYFNCLLKLKSYDEADKFIRNSIRKNKRNLTLFVDLGYVYTLQGDPKKAEKTFNEAIESIEGDDIQINALAAAFDRRNMGKQALEVYLKGRKLLNNDFLFASEMAELYGSQGNFEGMTNEYLHFLDFYPTQDEVPKTAFMARVDNDSAYQVIKETLIKRVQENPMNAGYVDLLSWLMIGKKEFYAAMIQLKSLDKRLNEGGRRIVELAKVCRQNREYKIAEACFQYVYDLGDQFNYYYLARLGIIDVQYERITQSTDYTQEELVALEQDYSRFVSDRYIPFTEKYKGYLRLAELRAVYIGKFQEAIQLLATIENNPQIPINIRGRAKIDMGNYYILSNDTWEATLKYSQVEKMFKDNPLGHEAKFLNARLSFYRGEFEWSKAQLDVLKGSTSELISNDALQLSLLIQDNIEADSNLTPLTLYANADKLIFMHQYDEAIITLDSITTFFPLHSLHDEILFAMGTIELKRRNYEKSISYFTDVFTKYNYDILADDALLKAAEIYEYQIRDLEKAKELYEKLLLEFKGSIFTVEARKRYRYLRGEGPDKSDSFFLDNDERP